MLQSDMKKEFNLAGPTFADLAETYEWEKIVGRVRTIIRSKRLARGRCKAKQQQPKHMSKSKKRAKRM